MPIAAVTSAQGACRCLLQRAAFFTNAASRFSSAGVNFVTAYDVGHIVPASRLAESLNPKVE